MKVTLCKCCGHPIVADEIGIVLTPLQRRIFNIVKRAGAAGISGRDIMDEVYANTQDGGPESTNIIAVVVNQMNRRLAQFSIKIQGRRGQGGVFKIERLKRHEVNSQVPTVEAAA
jgi:hypothetical protein